MFHKNGNGLAILSKILKLSKTPELPLKLLNAQQSTKDTKCKSKKD